VSVLAALNSSEDQVSDMELSRAHVSRLIELVDHILKHSLVAFLGVGLHSWAAVVDDRW
jgi:hypothetical protein